MFLKETDINYLTARPEPGIIVAKGDRMGYVINEEKFVARIKIPEKNMDKVRVGQLVKLYLSPYLYTEYKFCEGLLKSISTSAVKGYFIGLVEIPKENYLIKIRDKEMDLTKIIGTTLKAKIQLTPSNLISMLLGL